MRILHVSDGFHPHVGGIEVFVEDLATRQAALGEEVAVLTRTSGASSSAGAVRVHRTGPGRPLGGIALSSFDVVHAHLSVFSPLSTRVARAAVGAGVPTVLTVHSLWASRQRVVRTVSALAGWQRNPYTWTAVSRVAAEQTRQAVPGAPVRIVGNAVDVGWWRTVVEEHRGPVQDRPLQALAVMRLAPRKRPLALVDALTRVHRAAPESPLRTVIVGTGPLENNLRRAIARAGMEDRIVLTGALSREQIRDLCRESSIFLAPATQESFGIAPLEARAAGLAVVAMRNGGVGEFVTDGVDGLLCEDDAALSRNILRLATDPALRGGMLAHNAEVVPAHDWSDTLLGFQDAYAAAEVRIRAAAQAPRASSRLARTGTA